MQSRCGMNLVKRFICSATGSVSNLSFIQKRRDYYFSSEIKGLFAYPDIVPELDRNSLNEIFALGPAKTYGKGVFKNILEVLPGEHISISHTSFKKTVLLET